MPIEQISPTFKSGACGEDSDFSNITGSTGMLLKRLGRGVKEGEKEAKAEGDYDPEG